MGERLADARLAVDRDEARVVVLAHLGRGVLDVLASPLPITPSSERLPAGSFASDQVMTDAWLTLFSTVSRTARLAAKRTADWSKNEFGSWYTGASTQ